VQAPDKTCIKHRWRITTGSQKKKKLQPSPDKLQRGPWNEKANAIQSNIRLHLQIDAGSDDGLQLRRRGRTT
jgi:hypothetical protein